MERLERAEAELAAGRVDLTTQQDEVTDTVNSLYQNGDPELMAFTSLLQAQSPSDLTRQIEANHVLVDSETRVYDDLRAAEVLLEVREQQVEEARDEVAVQRAAAAEHLVEMKDLNNAGARGQAGRRGSGGGPALSPSGSCSGPPARHAGSCGSCAGRKRGSSS